ncbi:MAG: hypothetical protein GX338_01920 [Firmicutes bacterium]|nr:hypothetical protein [Bacillota bacterium]
MNATPKRLFALLFIVLVALLVAGCENPFVDSWSGETVDDALITFDGETYNLAALQNMKIPPGDYDIIVGSPDHHSIETTLKVGSRDVAKIGLVPYSRVYSPFVIEAVLCPAIDMRGQPVTARWDYSSGDAQVIAWVMWNVQDDSYHYQTVRWYRPDGILYRQEELPGFRPAPGSPTTTAPGLPLNQQPGWAVPPPADFPGIWVVEIIMDDICAVKMSFSI